MLFDIVSQFGVFAAHLHFRAGPLQTRSEDVFYQLTPE
jgi:hypothetical protein